MPASDYSQESLQSVWFSPLSQNTLMLLLPLNTLGIHRRLVALVNGLVPCKQCLFPALQPQADGLWAEAQTDAVKLYLRAH